MTEILLIRHAVNDYVKTGKLAGWTSGVHLNEYGQAQSSALGERLAHTHLDAIYSSPLERCVETAQAVLDHHPQLQLQLLEDVGEVRFGAWQGGELRKLSGRKLWRAVQQTPSRVRFPGGETIREAQMRAINALEMLAARHPRERIAVFSHSDLIKLMLAHFLGMHLDLFQRLDISPASLSRVYLPPNGAPYILQMNETYYLPAPKPEAKDERQIESLSPVASLSLEAIGRPGDRVFYLQATGYETLTQAPLTWVLEKTQALLLAEQIEGLLADPELQPSEFVPLTPPSQIMFRIGRFTLKYQEGDHGGGNSRIILFLEEMLGEGQGTPRIVQVGATRLQLRTLAAQARAAVGRGRQS